MLKYVELIAGKEFYMRFKVIFLVLLCILLISGCGKKTEPVLVNVPDQNEAEKAEEAKQEEEKTEEAEKEEDSKILDAPPFEKPQKMKFEMTMIQNGYESKITQYVDGYFIRAEVVTDEGNMVLISNPEERKNYVVNLVDQYVMVASFDDAAFLDMGYNEMIADMTYGSVDELQAIYPSVKEDELNGEAVYYIEAVDELGTYRMWVSKKYGYPVKSEYVQNGEIIFTTTAKITTEVNIVPEMFIPPSNLEIIDLTTTED